MANNGRKNRKTLTRGEFKSLPAWSLSQTEEIVITDYRKPKWVVLQLDEYERLKEAAGETVDLT